MTLIPGLLTSPSIWLDTQGLPSLLTSITWLNLQGLPSLEALLLCMLDQKVLPKATLALDGYRQVSSSAVESYFPTWSFQQMNSLAHTNLEGDGTLISDLFICAKAHWGCRSLPTSKDGHSPAPAPSGVLIWHATLNNFAQTKFMFEPTMCKYVSSYAGTCVVRCLLCADGYK